MWADPATVAELAQSSILVNPHLRVPGQVTDALINYAIWAWRLGVTDLLLSRNFLFR